MDIKTIFKVFKYQAKQCAVIQIISAFGGFLFGFGLLWIIMATDNSDTYFPMGTVIAGFACIVCSFIFIMRSGIFDFSNAVKMGVGRKNFLAGTALYHIAVFIVIPGLLYLFMIFETKVCEILFKSAVMDPEADLIQIFFSNIPMIAGIELLVLLAALSLGALILRFGLIGFWVAYGIFMIFSLSMAKIADIAPALNKINPAFIMPALILIFLIFGAASVRVYLKKEL